MRICIIHVSLLAGTLLGHSQGTFINLNFEEGYLPPVTTGYEPVSIALPGWTVLRGTNVETQISRNGYGPGAQSFVSINETRVWPIFADQYYLSFTRDGRDLISTSIYQTGVIPAGTMSLQFLTALVWFPGDMEVSVNGTSLPLQVLNSTPASALIGADISAYAGQAVELRITSLPYQEGRGINTYLDNIEFSPLPVPEPSAIASFLLGSGLLIWHRRAKRRDT